jgi:ribosomal protein L40E
MSDETKPTGGTAPRITHLTDCPKCGASNPPDARYCERCGASLAVAATGARTQRGGRRQGFLARLLGR